MSDYSYIGGSMEQSNFESMKLAALFKVFGDNTRVKILISLSEGDKCVSEIVSATNVSQSAVSHQLKLLKDSKLVKSQKEGRVITYSLADSHVHTIINMGLEHIREPE